MGTSRWLHAAMYVALAAYAVVLLLPAPDGPTSLLGGVTGGVAMILPAVLLARHGARHPAERRWAYPLAFGVFSYCVGDLIYNLSDQDGSVAFPSPADVGFLGIYPFFATALLVALRDRLRGVRLIVALDGLTGTLTGAALAALSVAPLIHRVWDGSMSAMTILAYPLCAVVVVALSIGALSIVGAGLDRALALWAGGMILFAMADIGYAYRMAYDSYQSGTVLDLAWPCGLALVATGATALDPHRRTTLPGTRSLLVVALASVASVGVLASAPGVEENPTPTVLALLALLTCGVRFVLAFRQLRELAVVREMARTDELTGIANRRALYAELDRMFATEDAPGGTPGSGQWSIGKGFALALVDLDHFKEVNDSYGHAAGDELLRVVVQRFSAALEELGTEHLFARLGGDEFAVILHDAGTRSSAMAIAGALQDSLAAPVEMKDVVLHARASIGVATAPLHAQNRADMLFAADAAMYAAKTSGEPICLHSPEAVGDRRKRLEVAESLYTALEREELTVEYQPILTAEGGLVGAEALVRWDHPTRGRLAPGEFLETAERYRLTPAIAERVLDVAMADLARWRSAGSCLTTSVNVSASDLRDQRLVKIVASALLRHSVPPEALVVEITETAMMRDPELAQQVMTSLHELGVQLAVDDYGTGYSSLEYLLKLPINEIKLDRAFSTHLVAELRATAIVRSTVDLTHALGLRMVAEGVEDEGTLFVLRELGCDLVQGWHLGRPMAADAFEQLIERAESVVERHASHR